MERFKFSLFDMLRAGETVFMSESFRTVFIWCPKSPMFFRVFSENDGEIHELPYSWKEAIAPKNLEAARAIALVKSSEVHKKMHEANRARRKAERAALGT